MDEHLVKLQERLKSLELSCSCCASGPGFGFAVDLPPAMNLILEEMKALRSDVETLRGILDVQDAKIKSLQAEKPKVKGRTRKRSAVLRDPEAKKIPGTGILD
jgi:hypothetical protein